MSNTSTFTISKKTKKEWLKRLRSGNYKQTSSELYTLGADAYCCLGVLCGVAGVENSRMAGRAFPHELGVADALSDKEMHALFGEKTFDKLARYGGFGAD